MRITNTVHVSAPPAKVWAAMAGVERWPEFAPQFKTIVRKDDGPIALGKSALVTPKGFFGAVWTVTEYTEGRSFTWEANMLPGLHLTAGHVVEPDGDGTRVTLSLASSGPASVLLALPLGRIFRRNVRQEGEGLKAYCERGAP